MSIFLCHQTFAMWETMANYGESMRIHYKWPLEWTTNLEMCVCFLRQGMLDCRRVMELKPEYVWECHGFAFGCDADAVGILNYGMECGDLVWMSHTKMEIFANQTWDRMGRCIVKYNQRFNVATQHVCCV